MQSTRSQGEPIVLFDTEHKRILRRMNNQQNPANLGDGFICQPPPSVDSHNQVVVENLVDDALRMKPPVPCPQEFYWGKVNVTDSDINAEGTCSWQIVI